jgi:hypothetical protein
LAITVIGGLTVATLLTLLVIPCIYRILGAAPVRVRVDEEAGVVSGSKADTELDERPNQESGIRN